MYVEKILKVNLMNIVGRPDLRLYRFIIGIASGRLNAREKLLQDRHRRNWE